MYFVSWDNLLFRLKNLDQIRPLTLEGLSLHGAGHELLRGRLRDGPHTEDLILRRHILPPVRTLCRRLMVSIELPQGGAIRPRNCRQL